ncbi:MAG: phenylalanine--tRNA ligase subunit beta, partial [Phycisphaerae bacterium]
RGVRVGPSPEWMVRRLAALGVRAINNVVDVTNYVLFELGQPLHAFDLAKVGGNAIVVRRARQGEKLISIDGKVRELTGEMLVIADERQPVALAGVMGGKDSEVSESTVDVLLESARFDALSVRKTSRALSLRSDSSYRFERGLDPALAELASRRAAELILQVAGGRLEQGVAVAGSSDVPAKRVSLRLARMTALLGVEFTADEAVDALKRLGFSPVLSADKARVDATVPSWRLDVNVEVDLIEEVARLVGYGRIPTRETIEIRLQPPEQDRTAAGVIRVALVAAGYHEALTFSWVADALRDDLRPAGAASLLRVDPKTKEKDAYLRPSVLPGLLEAVRRNQAVGNPPAKLFEMGSTFWADAAGKTDERPRLALVGSGEYREVRGAVEAVLSAIDATRAVKVTPDSAPGFAAAATGKIEWGGVAIGYVGKVDRAVADKLDLRESPVVAELELAPLLAGLNRTPKVQELGKFPSIKRDLSLVVDERVRYAEIEGALRPLGLADLESLDYVTTYRGKQLGEAKKSVTLQMVFRSAERTLTSEAVEASVQRAVAAVREKGWGLRE